MLTKKTFRTFGGMTDYIAEASSMDEAVGMAYKLSSAGDNVFAFTGMCKF